MVAIEPSPLKAGLYDRVGGWLVLPAIGTYLSPLYKAYSAYDVLRYYSDGLPIGSKLFIVGFGLACIGLTFAWLYACVLLSRLDTLFPNVYVGLLVVEIIIAISSALLVTQYFGATLEQDDIKETMRPIVIAVVWIPYMLVSKRVKATFYGIPISARPPPLREEAPAKRAVQGKGSDLTMVQRFGMVLYWAGLLIAGLLVIGALIAIANSRNGSEVVGYFCLAGAFMSWLIGRAIRYVLVGT
ncbi:DUF2569 domain-containing protein [Bradyrhizobium sp. AS23.2]|uniref:DUF2569 domain-containing protein n=1 Tax=Bradyrhizobium sp. AS23.2 TaxID=1680155 RepID=UPI000939FAAF|nr:DUF2569 domain-containing protein [Bradyrhizobium sp. AS23.2]